jgi:hypothetical protein
MILGWRLSVYPDKPINTRHSLNGKSPFFVPSLVLSNVMSLSPKIDELRLFAKEHKQVLMCFTETWLKDTVDNNAIFLFLFATVYHPPTADDGLIINHIT